MKKKKDNVFGLLFEKIYKGTKQELLLELERDLNNEKKRFIVTANPEAFMLAERKKSYEDLLLDEKTSIVADGIGLVKAGNIMDIKIAERIPGIDIAEQLIKYSNQYSKKLYLFGAKKEVMDNMQKMIKEKYSKIQLVGAKDGYEEDKDKVWKDIMEKMPDVVLVALGMPLQEELIYKYLPNFKKGIFVGVGGSFDVLSGSKKRAPKLFIKLNIEWLYRIIKEPKRLKRFYDNNIKFIIKVMQKRSN